MRTVTFDELRRILREHSDQLCRMLGEPRAQLSIPMDGRGLRILAGVPRPGASGHVMLSYSLDGKKLKIPVELSDDFENYSTHGGMRAAAG